MIELLVITPPMRHYLARRTVRWETGRGQHRQGPGRIRVFAFGVLPDSQPFVGVGWGYRTYGTVAIWGSREVC